MRDAGRGKTERACICACVRGPFDPIPGVIYEFCSGRGAQYRIALLQASDGFGAHTLWRGRPVRDQYSVYDNIFAARADCIAAG